MSLLEKLGFLRFETKHCMYLFVCMEFYGQVNSFKVMMSYELSVKVLTLSPGQT